MGKYFKAASIGLYLLTILVFFIGGAMVAGLSGAADNQGLAAGAIVVFWGMIVAFLAFVASIILAGSLKHGLIVRINWGLLALLIVLIAVLRYRHSERQKQRENIENKAPTPKIKAVYIASISSL